jgi:hypothetical protein
MTRPGVGGLRRGATVAAVVLGLLSALNPGLARAGVPPAWLRLDPDPPVPFEPMTITAAVDGCTPGGQGQATAFRLQFAQDVVWFAPIASGNGVVDDDGRIEVAVDLPRAYPGDWYVGVACDDQDDVPAFGEPDFSVPMPDSFALDVELTTLQRGEPFTIGLAGTGCVGGTVGWDLAVHPAAVLEDGEATPDAAGAWSTRLSGVVPIDWSFDGVGLQVWCIFADRALVQYELPPSLSTEVLPAVTDDGDDDDPVVVGPRFTG